MAADIHEQLTKYITDAHSIEVQALAQLEKAPDVAGVPALREALREHLHETAGHERRTRALLEERGAAPSRLKDLVMKAGGKGFLAFARAMPDTPGKLLAHALSYEALETAAYELLARTAERADEPDVARTALEICEDERAMIARLETCFDDAVDASLRAVEPHDPARQLRAYLADAHAIERQAIDLLERAPDLPGHPALAAVFDDHLVETREHAELLAERIDALGGDTSSIKDAAMRLGALNWATFFAAHPDTGGKLTAFAYAFEHLEIGGYEQLLRVARRAGDEETASLARRILEQERTAAGRLESMFDEAVSVALEERGVRAAR